MNDQKFVDRFGRWAVVTGASSGIGTEFARGVAAKGLSVVLVGRREARLKEVADEIEAGYGRSWDPDSRVETRVVATDLTEDGFLADIREATDPLDVGLVISNAGAESMGALLKVNVDELVSSLRLNTLAHLRLAHHFGAQLVGRGRGGILLVGSMAGMQGTPLGGNYAGAKAYIHNLGQAMNYELRDTGVHVSVTVPGPTNTPGLTERTDIDLAKLPGPVTSVDKVVAVGLKGLFRNKPLVIAGRANRAMDWVSRHLMPRQATRNVMGAAMNRHAPAGLRMQ